MRTRIILTIFALTLVACSPELVGKADTQNDATITDVSDATEVAPDDVAPEDTSETSVPDTADTAEPDVDDADPPLPDVEDAGGDASDAGPEDAAGASDADTALTDAATDARPADTGPPWPYTPGVTFRVGVGGSPALMQNGSETTLEAGSQGGFHINAAVVGNGIEDASLRLDFKAYDYSGRNVAAAQWPVFPSELSNGRLDSAEHIVFVLSTVDVQSIDAEPWVLVAELWADDVHIASDDIEIIVHCCDFPG